MSWNQGIYFEKRGEEQRRGLLLYNPGITSILPMSNANPTEANPRVWSVIFIRYGG